MAPAWGGGLGHGSYCPDCRVPGELDWEAAGETRCSKQRELSSSELCCLAGIGEVLGLARQCIEYCEGARD